MTQETAHMPLDERGVEAATAAVHFAADEAAQKWNRRAYLQTAAADVSGLVERLLNTSKGPAHG
jgi:hypothetical protein